MHHHVKSARKLLRPAAAIALAIGAFLLVSSVDAQTEPTTQPSPPAERPTGEHSTQHHGSSGGVGISVDLGNLFGGSDKSKPKPQATDTGTNEAGGKPPVIMADALPTPPKDDPAGGIPVPGGKVHRGTGTYTNPANPNDKRAAFYLWVDLDANGTCKECAWYQFAKVTVTLEGHDVTKTLGAAGAIENSIGGSTHFGKWDGDWHKKDEAKEKKKKPHVKMPGETPPVEAGPYAPRPIPGAGGSEGLTDAPNWGGTGGWEQLISRLADKGIIKKHATGDKPPDMAFTMVITTLFRDYLYCIDPPPPKCLGYSEETYVETIKYKLTWTASAGIDLGSSANTTWDAVVTVDSDDSKVTFGDWKGCT